MSSQSSAPPFTIYHRGKAIAAVHFPPPESRSPENIDVDPNQLPSAADESSSSETYLWQILLGLILVLLLAAAVVIPLVIFSFLLVSSTTTTTTTTTTTSTTTTTTRTTSTTSTTTTTTRTTSTTSTTTTTATTSTSTTSTTATAGTTVCSTTAITTTVTSSPLPSQCFSYTWITDSTRNAGYTFANYTCDSAGPMTSSGAWFRISGSAGTMLANCVVPIYRCSTHAPGWYSGVYPATAGQTTSGNVCYNWGSNSCSWSNSISVTNCNGYYVFFLITPSTCSLRYCTI